MKHKSLAVLAALLLAALPGLPARAETAGDLTYTVTQEGTVTVTDCDETAQHVTVPETIGGMPVTAIESRAFFGCTALASVQLPEGITQIGPRAFSGCTALTSVQLPESVTDVGVLCFDGTPWLSAQQGSGLVIAGSVVLDGTACTGDVVIPDGVRGIAGGAFRNCDGVTSVTLPEGLCTIGKAAFLDCDGLTAVTVPESVETVRGGAFSLCSRLTRITFRGYGCRILTEPLDLSDILLRYRAEPDGTEVLGAFDDSATFMLCNTGGWEFGDTGALYPAFGLYEGVICGYPGSGARDFAQRTGYTFVSLAGAAGDIDCDGSVGVLDAVMLQKHLVRVRTYGVRWLPAADLNADGRVDVLDLTLLKQMLL